MTSLSPTLRTWAFGGLEKRSHSSHGLGSLSPICLSLQEPFYVRCIKPNEDKEAGRLEEGHCRHQVSYLGLLENVRVRRAGFASRQPYPRFLLRYRQWAIALWASPPPPEGRSPLPSPVLAGTK
jgi:hypothetical protein